MPDKQLGARPEGSFQNPVAAFDGKRHRLFQIDRFSRLKRGDGDLLVILVAHHYADGIDVRIGNQLLICRIEMRFRIRMFPAVKFQHGGIAVADRRHFRFFPRIVVFNECGAQRKIRTD